MPTRLIMRAKTDVRLASAVLVFRLQKYEKKQYE